MLRARHELKYLIQPAQVATIAAYLRPYMRPDHHSPAGAYSLVSLYLDSPDLRLCRESLEGVKSRYKLRIRSYSDASNAPCFFEIKRRVDQVIVKSRAAVPRWAMAPLLAGAAPDFECSPTTCQNLEQFLHYQRQLQAMPILRVRYQRLAFESRSDDDVRVTFDRQLSFKLTSTPDIGLNGGGWRIPPNQAVVLEIKFTRGYPRWITRLVAECGLQPQSMSKYAWLIARACAMHYGAPAMLPKEPTRAVEMTTGAGHGLDMAIP